MEFQDRAWLSPLDEKYDLPASRCPVGAGLNRTPTGGYSKNLTVSGGRCYGYNLILAQGWKKK